MTLENELIQKKYFKNIIGEDENTDLVKVLAEASLEELKNELPDLSYIRYSQGEVYYFYKDFEAAIFKWENIHNELQPWARKNMADSYYELGMLQEAEEIYLSIETDNVTLKTEKALQLFSLYMEQDQLDQAAVIIKETVDLNPDYPNVTAIARSFFEEYRDYSSVIELTVNEALRTEEYDWFDTLDSYVNKRLTKTIEPDYFHVVLTRLAEMDQKRFERLTLSFWKSYQNGPFFFKWIEQVNELIQTIEVHETREWVNLSKQFEETYVHLIDGTYYINEITNVVPNLLSNWMKITHVKVITAAAVLAWEDVFPSKLSPSVLNDAQTFINQPTYHSDQLEQSLRLFEAIRKWAANHEMQVGNQFKWLMQELTETKVNHLLVAGSAGNGKSTFLNSILGEQILQPCHSTIVIKDHSELQISKLTETSIDYGLTIEEFHEITALRRQPHLIEMRLPSRYLREHNLAFIHLTNYMSNTDSKDAHMIDLADGLLFILSANTPFMDDERKILLDIKQNAPDLPVHFILNKIDVFNEHESARILQETEAVIHSYFPRAKVLAYSSISSQPRLRGLTELLETIKPSQNVEQQKNKKRLLLIRKMITHLLQKRVEKENELIESIHWNEEVITKLNGAIHQLGDLEKEKIQVIKDSYQKIKEEMKRNLEVAVPELLRASCDFVTEKSDFRKLHIDLNKEMNNRVQEYIKRTILPTFINSIHQWLETSNVEFIRTQSHLKEMCEGFNRLYHEEHFNFNCDFRILDDWYRDMDRMTDGVRIDEVNVLLRLNPSQLLLKSSGKLFGVLPSNKAMLVNLYKKFIENEKYEQVTETIIKQFMLQFELFERGLERDISMSFRNPFTVIEEAIKEAESQKASHHDSLNKLKSNPEIYVDPLTLFKVKLRQYELMEDGGRLLQSVT